MRTRRLTGILATAVIALTAPGRLCAGPQGHDAIPALLDKLTEVSDPDVGYSGSVSGEVFLPTDSAGQIHTVLLGQRPPAPSETLRRLVKRGAAAVPGLLAHLDDRRPTRLRVRAMFGGFWGLDEPGGKPASGTRPREESYTVTVGDLCFVALGQIVNRPYYAIRYQPTALIIVNSPTRSPALRAAVRREWAGLTPERHRASLVADFARPGRGALRVGAAKRLAYYYPDALEPLALRFLARPTYSVFAVERFVRQVLYREPDPAKCRALFDAYVKRHGEASRDGILLQFFDDLELLEANEQKRLSPPLTDFADQPRELLIHLYRKPKDVKSKDRPTVASLSDPDKAEFIREGLTYDHDAKIDRAVRDLLAAADPDDAVGWACVERLVGRGYDADIEAFCRRASKQAMDTSDRGAVQQVRGRLGWTPSSGTV